MKYDSNSIQCIWANGTHDSLSNLCGGDGFNKCATIFDFKDAVEDSEDAKDLVAKISALNLFIKYNFRIDRDTATYTRLRGKDCYGNLQFIVISKSS